MTITDFFKIQPWQRTRAVTPPTEVVFSTQEHINYFAKYVQKYAHWEELKYGKYGTYSEVYITLYIYLLQKKKTLKIKCFTIELIRLNHINFFITENKLGIKKFLIYKLTHCNCWDITKVFYIEYIYQIVSVIIWRVS